MSEKLIEEIFEDLLQKIVENNNQISDQVIGDLMCLFDKTFIKSIAIIDNKRVSKMVSSSDRHVFQVDSYGSARSDAIKWRNLCFIDCNYCNCAQFQLQGIKNEKTFLCQHLIAAKLSNAMKCFQIIQITDEQMKKMLIQSI